MIYIKSLLTKPFFLGLILYCLAAGFLTHYDTKDFLDKGQGASAFSTRSFLDISQAKASNSIYKNEKRLRGRGHVLVVGDSLEVLTQPFLERKLAGLDMTHLAMPGYTSRQVFTLFEEEYTRDHSVVVFDAGTNDDHLNPRMLRRRLLLVSKIIGPQRCLVTPTLRVFARRGVSSESKNNVILALKKKRDLFFTPDWGGVSANRPDLMRDRIHPNNRGAQLRAKMIAKSVNKCLDSGLLRE